MYVGANGDPYLWTVEPDDAEFLSDGEIPMRVELVFGPNVEINALSLPEPRDAEPVEVEIIASVLDGWRLRARMRSGQDGPEVFDVHLEQADGEAVIGTNVLRRLGLGGVLDMADRWLGHPVLAYRAGQAWGRPVRRPGRRGADPHTYAVIAARYARALRASPRAPYEVMVAEAKSEGRHETNQALRAAVRRARTRGLLTEAEGRKAGGELTELGKRLAREMGEEV